MRYQLISETMTQKHITAYRLSKLTGVQEITIGELIKGKKKRVSFDTVSKIAKALDIDLNDLVEEE